MQVFRRKKSETAINSPYHNHSRSVSGPIPLVASSTSLQGSAPTTPVYQRFAQSVQQQPTSSSPSRGDNASTGASIWNQRVSMSLAEADTATTTTPPDVTTMARNVSPQRHRMSIQPQQTTISGSPPPSFYSSSPMPLAQKRTSMASAVTTTSRKPISMSVVNQNKPLPPPNPTVDIPPVLSSSTDSQYRHPQTSQYPTLPQEQQQSSSITQKRPPPQPYPQDQVALPPLTSTQVNPRISSVNATPPPRSPASTKLKKSLPQPPKSSVVALDSYARQNLPTPIATRRSEHTPLPNADVYDSNHGRRYSPLAAFGPPPTTSPRRDTFASASSLIPVIQPPHPRPFISQDHKVRNGTLPPVNTNVGNRQPSAYVVTSPIQTMKSLEENRALVTSESPSLSRSEVSPPDLYSKSVISPPKNFVTPPPPPPLPITTTDPTPSHPSHEVFNAENHVWVDDHQMAGINISRQPVSMPLDPAHTSGSVIGNENTPLTHFSAASRPNDGPNDVQGRAFVNGFVRVPGQGTSAGFASTEKRDPPAMPPPLFTSASAPTLSERSTHMGQKFSNLRLRSGEESINTPSPPRSSTNAARNLPVTPSTAPHPLPPTFGPPRVGSANTSFVEILPPINAGKVAQRDGMIKSGSASSSGSSSLASNELGFKPETPASSIHELSNVSSSDAIPIQERENSTGAMSQRKPDAMQRSILSEVAKPIVPITIPLESVKKVSYNPMPARRKAEIDVDKRGRVITPPRTISPLALRDTLAEPEVETYYPLLAHLMEFNLFAALLPYLSFPDYLAVSSINPLVRKSFDEERHFREEILEKFLGSVGYLRWEKICTDGEQSSMDPLFLNLKDLNAYMRAVSIPPHRYVDLAEDILQNHRQGMGNGSGQVKLLAKTCRAYSRVVLRLRAQAEVEADTLLNLSSAEALVNGYPANGNKGSFAPTSFHSPTRDISRPPSRAGSVVSSSNDHRTTLASHHTPVHLKPKFRSPLYRLNHAPLLRVFVLSPEGPWLSDATILECEKELKRTCSGAKGRLSKGLLRVGDIVWNCAVGDEGNLGRSIWDGNYLIDLDYTYSKIGGIPKYLHSLSFPPSYFHKVLRMGSGVDADPIVQIDIAPFGDQIAANLQLLQERVPLETPQGGRHTVLRWTHRSRFRLLDIRRSHNTLAIPIPNAENVFVDAAWAGAVVVETEGTNEGLAELQARCGSAFPQFRSRQHQQAETSRVFRLLRERSRPGEIWIRLVREKDRIV